MSSDHIWPILFFVSLAGNLILLFYRPLLRLLRRGEEVSEDEIMAMVEEGEESGAIERNEKELIENVFEFNNTTAEDVMIHRTDMVTLSLDDDEETILSAIRESGLSRFPVYQGNVDDIVGILSTRQYLLNFHVERPQELRALLRPAYFVPETVRADVLFRDMQSKKIHMAVVVDEYGGTSGLVTLEDLLEELVGNIYDEFDPQAEQEIIQLEQQSPLAAIREFFLLRERYFQQNPEREQIFETALLHPPRHLMGQIGALHAPIRDLNKRFIAHAVSRMPLRPGLTPEEVTRYLECLNTYFWPVAVQDRAASGVSDVHSMFRMAGELLDLALFGVVQQPGKEGTA